MEGDQESCISAGPMRFEWDSANIGHIAVHNVTPYEAEEVLLHAAVALDVRIHNGEERTRFIGETSTGRILVVVLTQRGGLLRVVTAFPANRTVRRVYLLQKEMDDEDTEDA